jgi:L,D-peptidoglycan transpeptidase YkuD (ErfK/YbiS/YcfS/YnhG family)
LSQNLIASITAGTLSFGTQSTTASFGRTGACPAPEKREGDGKTPLGIYTLQTALIRPDRGLPAPATSLPWRWLRPADGWSDAPQDPAYNRPVTHPHPHSAEQLWRDDHAYDIIITLSHNTPPKPGLGSAVFLHCLQPDSRPTEGCIAVSRDMLQQWLPRFHVGTVISMPPAAWV